MKTKKLFILWTILSTMLISTSRVEAQKIDISSQITLANEFYHEKNYRAAADIFEKAHRPRRNKRISLLQSWKHLYETWKYRQCHS